MVNALQNFPHTLTLLPLLHPPQAASFISRLGYYLRNICTCIQCFYKFAMQLIFLLHKEYLYSNFIVMNAFPLLFIQPIIIPLSIKHDVCTYYAIHVKMICVTTFLHLLSSQLCCVTYKMYATVICSASLVRICVQQLLQHDLSFLPLSLSCMSVSLPPSLPSSLSLSLSSSSLSLHLSIPLFNCLSTAATAFIPALRGGGRILQIFPMAQGLALNT